MPNFFNSGLFHHAKDPLEEILKTKLKGPLTVITLNDFCAILLDDILVTQLWEADTSADAQMSTLRSDQNYHQTCWQASPAREPEGKQEMGKSNIFQKLLIYQIITIILKNTILNIIHIINHKILEYFSFYSWDI